MRADLATEVVRMFQEGQPAARIAAVADVSVRTVEDWYLDGTPPRYVTRNAEVDRLPALAVVATDVPPVQSTAANLVGATLAVPAAALLRRAQAELESTRLTASERQAWLAQAKLARTMLLDALRLGAGVPDDLVAATEDQLEAEQWML